MADFKPIETQEQFDAMIKGRLEQAERSFIEKYGKTDELKTQLEASAGQIAELTQRLEEANNQIESSKAEMEGLNAKVLKYETDSVKTRVAHEEGLPFEMAGRLTGDNEEAIRADAKSLAKMIKANTSTPPAFKSELPPPEKPSTRDKFAEWFNSATNPNEQ